ncbi:MAG: hypothetical protein GY730_01605, partial [bacterium]|nr:hypothetical protein [bacterium]
MSDKTNSIEIQSSVSRFKSIRIILADLYWKNYGLSNFFTERIPFSARNGKAFAEKLAGLYIKTLELKTAEKKSNSDNFIHVYELGAGHGLLSKFFLDTLHSKYPEIYKQTIVHITDNSKLIIKKLRKLSIFKKHSNNISFQIIDAAEPEFNSHELPFFIYSSQLIDALPAYHIEADKKEVSELLIKTTINEDASLLDTSVYPPVPIDAKTIKKILLGKNKKKKLLLAPRILPLLKEEIVKQDIETTSYLSPENKASIKEFISSSDITEKTYFNYSPEIESHISTVSSSLLPEGLYVTSDFGFSQKTGHNTSDFLLAGYCSTSFYSVCFPLIFYLSNKSGLISLITNQDLDQTQDLILYKGSKVTQLSEYFKNNFDTVGYEKISSVLDRISSFNQEMCTLDNIKKELDRLCESDKK